MDDVLTNYVYYANLSLPSHFKEESKNQSQNQRFPTIFAGITLFHKEGDIDIAFSVAAESLPFPEAERDLDP